MAGTIAGAADTLLAWISQQASQTSLDDSLAGVLEHEFRGDHVRRSPWWIVTEVVNPAQTYHRLVRPIAGHDGAIERKLFFGKFVHEQLAPAWFAQLPGFAVAEAGVDGAQVHLAGVRGRVDFRVGHAIYELKTTQLELNTPSEVLSHSPQDLEQLVLYALMTNREGEEHELVYYHPLLGRRFRVFTVKIVSGGPIAQHFRARMATMARALEASDPTELGQCRYYNTGCDYRIRNLCGCGSLPVLDIDEIVSNVNVVRNEVLESRLESIREGTTTTVRSRIRLWDLFSPRQAFRALTDPSEMREFVRTDDYERRRWYERRIGASRLAGPFEEISLPVGESEPLVVGRNATVRIEETIDGGVRTTFVPYLVRLAGRAGLPPPDRLSEAWKGQLGARCALRGNRIGMLIVVNTEHQHQTACYRIQFSDLEGITSRLRTRSSLLSQAIALSDYDILPRCPAWLQTLCDIECLCSSPTEAEPPPSAS